MTDHALTDDEQRMALVRASFFQPGPLVAGTKLPNGPITYKFNPIGSTVQPSMEVRKTWRCPHGAHELEQRYYPDIDPPALFLDCMDCRITWEMPVDG